MNNLERIMAALYIIMIAIAIALPIAALLLPYFIRWMYR